MKQKREWSFHEWSIPSSWPAELLPKPKPLTEKEQKLWNEVQELIKEARKWKKQKNRKKN